MQRIVCDLPKSFEIIAGSCTHVGSIMCHRDGIKYAVDYIASGKNRYFIHLGDWIEAICTDDKRYQSPPDDKKDKEQPIPIKQAKDAVDLFKPIKKRILTGLIGNHERKLSKFGNLVDSIICSKEFLNIPYGTENCRIIINNNGKPLFNIHAMHGKRIFKSNAKDYEQREANKKAALKLYLQNQMGDCAIQLCVSEDTEILTYMGWKKKGEITYEDKILTFNTEKEIAEFNDVENIIDNNDYGELLYYKNNVVDLAVTTNHDILVKTQQTGKPIINRKHDLPKGVYKKRNKYVVQITRNNKKVYISKPFKTIQEALDDYNNVITSHILKEEKWIKIKADQLLKRSQVTVPVSVSSKNIDYNMSSAFIKLIGLLVSEGHFRENGAVQLYQRESKAFVIRDVLKENGIRFTEYYKKTAGRKFRCPHSGKEYITKENIITFYISVVESKKITKFIYNKKIPYYVWDFSDKQFDVLIEYMMFGDGHWATYNHSGCYYTSDEKTANYLQMLCITHGWKASINKRNGSYEIGIHKTKTTTLVKGGTIKQYNGRTWCVTVKNGTIFTRRNGKVAIIGNCGHAHWIGIVPPSNILYFMDGEKGVKQNYLKGLTHAGYIQPDQRWYACCGSARKSRLDGYDDYAQEYEPTDLGFVKIVVEDGEIIRLERFLI